MMNYNRLAPLLNANYYMFGSQTMFDRVWLIFNVDKHLRVYATKDRAKLEIDPKIKILKLCQNKAYYMPD